MKAALYQRLPTVVLAGLLALMVLCVLWELWLAPLRPGGSWLALKALPLLLALRGVLRRSTYTMQWLAMLCLLYFMEGVVRAWSDLQPLSAYLALVEAALALLIYLAALLYLYPLKRAARASAKRKP